jgi:hypothetical protein
MFELMVSGNGDGGGGGAAAAAVAVVTKAPNSLMSSRAFGFPAVITSSDHQQ